MATTKEIKSTATTTSENTVSEVEAKDTAQSYKIKQLDPHDYVTVKNGFQGTLIYKSKKTGEIFVWDDFGDEQDIELQELKSAKNSSKSFFINNWFLFDDPEVIEWLGMKQYYKYALDVQSFDELFSKTPGEIDDTVSKLSDGQKKTLAFRAKQKISEGLIDSLKVIDALETSLNITLIER